VIIMRKTFQTNKAPGGVAPLSALTVGGGLVFLSGLTAMDPVTGTIEGDAAAQADKALQIVEDVLKDYGLTTDDVLRCTLYLRDMGDFSAVNPVYASHFNEPYPAHTCVEVAKLPLGAMFEIDIIAEDKKED
jgi:2-iminobutanoate/2-iminopropanoate deaminase